MKKQFFIPFVSLLFLFSCSEKNNGPEETPTAGFIFELSAVNELGPVSKGPIYSQEAVHSVEDVKVYTFQKSGINYLYYRTDTITNWVKGSNFNRYEVPDSKLIPMGDYMFLAIGRDLNDLFTLPVLAVGTTNYNDMIASIAAAGQEVEIFAGSKSMTIASQGARIPIQIVRRVGGFLGYFKNVPTNIDGTDVKYLRLSVNNSNKSVNVTTSVGSNPTNAIYNILNVDLSTQGTADGVFTGNDLTLQGVVKLPNTQLYGAYIIPINGVNLTLGLYSASNAPLKTWTVSDGISSSLTIQANHFFALGTKTQTGNTNGGGGEGSTPDAPIDLLKDQVITVTIFPAWGVIHNLVIEEESAPTL